jgi:hypothetical protein
MSSASDYLENKVLDHTLRVAAYTQPAGLFIGLFNNTSTATAANLEAGIITDETSTSGTGYQRKAVTFSAAANGSATTSAVVTFDAATASWGTLTHIAILDAQTGGNVLYWGELATAKTIATSDIFQINAGNLTVSLA